MSKTFLVLALIGLSQCLFACDACGCSSTMGFDLSYNLKSNSIFIVYNKSSFTSNLGRAKELQDKFNTVSINGRYFLSDKISIIATLPYQSNNRIDEESNLKLSGFGDVRFTTSWKFIDDEKPNGVFYGDVGIGIKLPTGVYNADIHSSNLPENFNLGNGSFGLLSQLNLMKTANNWIYTFSEMYLHHFKSKSGYNFGNQNLMQLNVGRKINIASKAVFNVLVGCFWESVSKDKYATGATINHTGGNGIFGVTSLGLRYKDIYLGTSYNHPINSSYSGNEVNADSRFAMQINYFLN